MRARAPGERTRERARHCIAKSARGEGGGTRGKCPYPGAAARQDSRLNYVEQHSERLGLDAGRLETLRVRRPARPQHYGFYLSCTEWLCTSGSVSPVATQWPRGQPQRAPGAGPCWGMARACALPGRRQLPAHGAGGRRRYAVRQRRADCRARLARYMLLCCAASACSHVFVIPHRPSGRRRPPKAH